MKSETGIYLDYNATTPVDPRVLQFMLPYFGEHFANAGSPHLFGLLVSEAVENAQQQTADLINAKPHEIVFTSGATESVNLAIQGFRKQSKKHIITFASEHKAVLETCAFMESDGFTVSYLPVDADGKIDLKLFSDAFTSETFLVCAMLANNETGVLHPITEIAKITHENAANLLCDATQAVGKIPVDVKVLDVDFLAFSAHKFYGPKGIGGLYISSKVKNKPEALILGGRQQRNRRSGTLNVPGIVAMGKACEIAKLELNEKAIQIGKLRDQLENGLLQIKNTFVNGNIQNRLFNTTNICFTGIDSEKLILLLKNISVSNGSACSAITTEPSHVLKAMGLSDADALASIRFSLGKFNTSEEINTTIKQVTLLVDQFRN